MSERDETYRTENVLDTTNNISPLVVAAHELKSPLALVRQLSFLLSEDNVDEKTRIDIATKIRLSSEKALRLTGDLTKSARLEDAIFQVEPINPVQFCNDIAFELKPLMDVHKRTINVFSSKKHPLLLVANRDLLRRIVVGFTDNALHYGEPNTTIELAISTLNRGQIVRLAVRDFGPSLRRDVRRNIKHGRQLNKISGRPESSGLGLYLASKFADTMDGKIGAISHRDGATFYIDLHASRQLNLL